MQSYNIRYLPIAENDLNEILDYLSEYSIDAANRLIDALENLENTLSMFPESVPLIRNIRLRSRGYRVSVIGDYLLFCILRDDDVYIMRIIHCRRNYLSIL